MGDVSVYRRARTLYTYDCQAFPSRDKAPAPTCAGHHTLRSGGSVHGDTPEIVERVLPLLQRHRVAAYIAGHDHDLQHIRTDGLDYLCCGAGSQVRPVKPVEGTRFCAARSGFALLRLDGRQLAAEFQGVLLAARPQPGTQVHRTSHKKRGRHRENGPGSGPEVALR